MPFQLESVVLVKCEYWADLSLKLIWKMCLPESPRGFSLDFVVNVLNNTSGSYCMGFLTVSQQFGLGEVMITVAMGYENGREGLLRNDLFDPSCQLTSLLGRQWGINKNCFIIAGDER